MSDTDHEDPLIWLLLLERGRQTGDFELAARAKRELKRLGVRVTYCRPSVARCRQEPRSAEGLTQAPEGGRP